MCQLDDFFFFFLGEKNDEVIQAFCLNENVYLKRCNTICNKLGDDSAQKEKRKKKKKLSDDIIQAFCVNKNVDMEVVLVYLIDKVSDS